MLYKRASKIHGKGVYTSDTIKAGSKFYIVPTQIYRKSPKPRWARLRDVWVSDKQVLDYINHSCSPDCYIDIPNHSLVSLRQIDEGEEITCDYNLTETDGAKVPCNCGSRNCRGYFLKE